MSEQGTEGNGKREDRTKKEKKIRVSSDIKEQEEKLFGHKIIITVTSATNNRTLP